MNVWSSSPDPQKYINIYIFNIFSISTTQTNFIELFIAFTAAVVVTIKHVVK